MRAEDLKLGCYQLLILAFLSVNFVTVSMSHALSLYYKHVPANYSCPVGQSNEKECEDGFVAEAGFGCLRSVVTEWGLVCNGSSGKPGPGTAQRLVSLVYFTGLLMGGWLAGLMIDRAGRMPVLAVCLYAQGIAAIALYLVKDFKLLLVFRGLQGFFIQGLESSSFILCMELFPTRYRTLVTLAVLSMRSLGFGLFFSLTYIILDWRILQLVASIPTAITVFYIWMIPESPRWLFARGKLIEADMLLERFTKYNGLLGKSETETSDTSKQRRRDCNSAAEKPPDESHILLRKPQADGTREIDIESVMKRCSEESMTREANRTPKRTSLMLLNERRDESSVGAPYEVLTNEPISGDQNTCNASKSTVNPILRFMRSRFIGSTCAILMFMWFSTASAFHLRHSSGELSRPMLIKATLMEIGVFCLAYPLATLAGRRRGLCTSLLLLGTACLSIGLLDIFARPLLQSYSSVIDSTQNKIEFCKKIFNIISFFILRLFAIELFPTISRGTGLGLCIAAEMCGGLLIFPILSLNKYVQHLPRFLISSVCICAGLLALTFPETLRKVLPDSVEDARRIGMIEDLTDSDGQRSKDPGVLREKLFSEDWVDAGNGVIVNFTDSNKLPE
ncbi:hypothetical protein QAD02_012103 [Eretmocerus hayati]|uniref:Uncharacterized protein n=1 Tax=Eretmocerus hayati TaxID=131215 RepID=A0ACC2P0F4_9HYME|nr:hypothetical protein QAD02_012103 [Eretmocerus hayati]